MPADLSVDQSGLGAASGGRVIQKSSSLSSTRDLVLKSLRYWVTASGWKISSISMVGSPPKTPLQNSG